MHDHVPMIAADSAFWVMLSAVAWAGLLGGFTHCAGMCGPFVLAQTARAMTAPGEPLGELRRLRGAALLPYHFGRGVIYTGLGAIGGALSSAIVQAEIYKIVAAVLLSVAGLLMILPLASGTRRLSGGGIIYARLLDPLISRLNHGNGFALGLALGFLPCGLVYAALAVSAASSNGWSGAAIMAVFAAGTMPGLIAVAFLGEVAGRRWRKAMARTAPWLMAANGAAMLALAATAAL